MLIDSIPALILTLLVFYAYLPVDLQFPTKASSYARTHPDLGNVRQPNLYSYSFLSLAGGISQVEMKLQLFFVLVFELLHCSFGNVAQEPDEFCDEGPPGKYCLEDLSGWHDCHVDPSTGKMADKVYSCPANTR